MTIVINASVAVKWVLDEPGSAEAAALCDQQLIAPALWHIEAANALWRVARRGQITTKEAADRLAELLNAPVATLAVEPYLGHALDLAAAIAHPVHDCLYLALAIRHQTYVIAADRRFASAANLPDLSDHIRLLASRAAVPPAAVNSRSGHAGKEGIWRSTTKSVTGSPISRSTIPRRRTSSTSRPLTRSRRLGSISGKTAISAARS